MKNPQSLPRPPQTRRHLARDPDRNARSGRTRHCSRQGTRCSRRPGLSGPLPLTLPAFRRPPHQMRPVLNGIAPRPEYAGCASTVDSLLVVPATWRTLGAVAWGERCRSGREQRVLFCPPFTPVISRLGGQFQAQMGSSFRSFGVSRGLVEPGEGWSDRAGAVRSPVASPPAEGRAGSR
jgi:hypothetical protein